MENEATTKTPILIHWESLFWILSPVFCLLPYPPSTLVETPLQISLFLQNKPNFKMGNINISTARTKAYAKEQRTVNNKRYPKQTQSNPIHHGEAGFCPCPNHHTCPNSAPIFPPPSSPFVYAMRDTQYAIRNTRYAIRPVLIYTSGRGSSPARSRITGVMLSQPIGIR